MAEVKYLLKDEATPVAGDEEPWLIVEPFDNDGKFYATGWSRKANGESVYYASLAENDVSLEKALNAAQEWAEKYKVPAIFVRKVPKSS